MPVSRMTASFFLQRHIGALLETTWSRCAAKSNPPVVGAAPEPFLWQSTLPFAVEAASLKSLVRKRFRKYFGAAFFPCRAAPEFAVMLFCSAKAVSSSSKKHTPLMSSRVFIISSDWKDSLAVAAQSHTADRRACPAGFCSTAVSDIVRHKDATM